MGDLQWNGGENSMLNQENNTSSGGYELPQLPEHVLSLRTSGLPHENMIAQLRLDTKGPRSVVDDQQRRFQLYDHGGLLLEVEPDSGPIFYVDLGNVDVLAAVVSALRAQQKPEEVQDKAI
jgi:hypothetical protein